jgi:ABC-type Fe3+-citrate transport system substrate-binding protein
MKKVVDNPVWLAMVRDDLDSDTKDWMIRTSPDGISKLQAIGTYLDTILTELGYPPTEHKCDKCGKTHRAHD